MIAEKSAQFGFPEVLFNLFPGMGAYNFLSRRIGMARTERMILCGKTFGAEELVEDGVIDIVAEDGKGENALYEYIGKHSRKKLVYDSLFQVRRGVFPVRHEEMMEVSELWVDTALRIGPRDTPWPDGTSDQSAGKTPRTRTGARKRPMTPRTGCSVTGQETAELRVPRYSSSAVLARESSSFTSSR